MKELKPVILNTKNILDIEKQIAIYLKDVLFQPLADIYKLYSKSNIILNEISDELKQALKSNKLYVKDNCIYGTFNSRITKQLEKLGGKYSSRSKCFKFEVLPAEITDIVLRKKDEVKNIANKIDEFLNDFIDNIEYSIAFMDIDLKPTIKNYNKQLQENFKDVYLIQGKATEKKVDIKQFGIESTLSIIPDVSEQQQEAITKDYVDNMKLSIKGFTQKQIEQLRKKMQDFVLNEGTNTNDIAEYIQDTFKVSQTRSLFLARQESNLLLANFTENKYRGLGITRYKWQTANDERVRNYPFNNKDGDNHKDLDGKIFSFNDPPIVNKITGERANPSEQYNCRCVAVPILD